MINGSAPSFSHDGNSLAFIAREGAETRLVAAPLNEPSRTNTIRGGPERLDAPTWSPDGTRIAFQMMPKDDWEIFVVGRDGSGETRVTREIQHDVLPRFSRSDRLLAAMGEPRHRRSYLYDLPLDGAHAALPQQHRPDDRAGVHVGCRAPTARRC